MNAHTSFICNDQKLQMNVHPQVNGKKMEYHQPRQIMKHLMRATTQNNSLSLVKVFYSLPIFYIS